MYNYEIDHVNYYCEVRFKSREPVNIGDIIWHILEWCSDKRKLKVVGKEFSSSDEVILVVDDYE